MLKSLYSSKVKWKIKDGQPQHLLETLQTRAVRNFIRWLDIVKPEGWKQRVRISRVVTNTVSCNTDITCETNIHLNTIKLGYN